MPVRVIITSATAADCTKAQELVGGIAAKAIIADKAYDTNSIVDVMSKNMEVVIPPKSNRKIRRTYDKYLYRLRHLVENAFLRMKEWRGIAFRFAKNTGSYIAAVQIRCLIMWLKII